MRGKILAALALSFVASEADAAATLSFQQQGGSVVATLSGSLDLSGSTQEDGFTNPFFGGAISPVTGEVASYPTNADLSLYLPVSGPSSFGTGTSLFADAAEGISFYLSSTLFFVESAYVSGGALSGSLTFNNTTIDAIGLSTDDSIYTLASGDTFTIRSITAAVPEPATWAMMLMGFALTGYAMRRRRVTLAAA